MDRLPDHTPSVNGDAPARANDTHTAAPITPENGIPGGSPTAVRDGAASEGSILSRVLEVYGHLIPAGVDRTDGVAVSKAIAASNQSHQIAIHDELRREHKSALVADRVRGRTAPPADAPDRGAEKNSKTDYHEVAAIFCSARAVWGADLAPRLVYHRGDWLCWEAGAWTVVPDQDLMDEVVVTATLYCPSSPASAARNLLEVLRATLHVSDAVDWPRWADDPHGLFPAARSIDPADLIAFPNGILDVGKFLADDPRCLYEATPRFLTRSTLTFDWAPAPTPTPAWDAFLRQLWPDDPASTDLLHEWMGYCLVPGDEYQKMLFLGGASAGGKGTILGVLRDLVGPRNYAAVTTAALGSTGGKQSLLGKTVGVVPDMRLRDSRKTGDLLELILTIVGNDRPMIDRKYKEAVPLQPLKLVITSNDPPAFPDDSPALMRRLLILWCDRSFEGHADPTLGDRLRAELPGILHHTLAGLKRLRKNGRFSVGQATETIAEVVRDSSSRFALFIREHCETGPEYQVTKADLYEAWKRYCDDDHVAHGPPGAVGKMLLAACPGVRTVRPRRGGEADAPRQRVWFGVDLTPEAREQYRLGPSLHRPAYRPVPPAPAAGQ
jgi:putative DNA primase/helicase